MRLFVNSKNSDYQWCEYDEAPAEPHWDPIGIVREDQLPQTLDCHSLELWRDIARDVDGVLHWPDWR